MILGGKAEVKGEGMQWWVMMTKSTVGKLDEFKSIKLIC